MKWDTSSVHDEPVTVADILEEERESSDYTITSDESTASIEEIAEGSAADNESDADASNPSEESDDAEAVRMCIEDDCIGIENPFEDEELQNFQADEIWDILARLNAISKELDEDKERLEMQAMVLADYSEEELEESDSGDDMDQVANNEERDVIEEVISGLGPQRTAQQKIQEWLEKMV